MSMPILVVVVTLPTVLVSVSPVVCRDLVVYHNRPLSGTCYGCHPLTIVPPSVRTVAESGMNRGRFHAASRHSELGFEGVTIGPTWSVPFSLEDASEGPDLCELNI